MKQQSIRGRDLIIKRLRVLNTRWPVGILHDGTSVWWNGELIPVTQAIILAAQLDKREPITMLGKDVYVPGRLLDQ